MAKSTKPKKEKLSVAEEATPEIIEEVVPEAQPEETPVEEPVIPEPIVEEIKVEEKESRLKIDGVTIKAEVVDLPMEQRILNFVENRSGEIKLNDFIKSLYGVPKFGEPSLWLSQGASKEIKGVLNKLCNEGLLGIVSNSHMKLGTFYYPDTSTMKTEYHNLNTIRIIAVKVN